MTVAVVTGAGSGIGAALARALGRRQDVVVTDLDVAAAERVAAGIPNASAIQLDVTDAAAVERVASQCEPVDLWINNAGVAVGGATADLALADWRRVLDVNLAGVVHGVHAIYPRMVARGSGHIVNIASVAGLAPYPLALPYTTSKHAVVGMSLALRAEARGLGVRVSVACPGAIDTPIWERSPVRGALATLRERALARMPRMDVDACAAAILDGVAANRAVIPVTAEAHLAWRLTRVSPALFGRLGDLACRLLR